MKVYVYLLFLLLCSSAEAKTALEHTGQYQVYEKTLAESTERQRLSLNLPIGTTREEIELLVTKAVHEELTREKIPLTVRSVTQRTLWKRVGLICGLDIHATTESIRDCLGLTFKETSALEAREIVYGCITIETMHLLAKELRQPVSNFYGWEGRDLNDKINNLPDTPITAP